MLLHRRSSPGHALWHPVGTPIDFFHDQITKRRSHAGPAEGADVFAYDKNTFHGEVEDLLWAIRLKIQHRHPETGSPFDSVGGAGASRPIPNHNGESQPEAPMVSSHARHV